jgi:UDP-N-acetylglucosamine--N-acetylmuramyl-(pentapeptide) pyrophosphoryl-undecaprenol N-acetylglucosamine transferase
MPEGKAILLSAGGTGGHLFPAEALAQELLARGHAVVIVTDKRGHAFKSLGNVAIRTVRAATLKGGIVNKIRAVIDMATGIAQAALILRKYKPAAVVGFGGYPSFPAAFAAEILGFPVILHEQNAVPGKANKLLARGAKAVAISLPGAVAGGVDTGNPVRAAIVAAGKGAYAAPSDSFKILITGGSQAARVFGEVVPSAVALLPDHLKKILSVMHQSPESDVAAVREKYRAAGVAAEVLPFFTDMPERLSACHLFIGRSGASTVAEVAVVGRPAIFVPYPGHRDMQQKHNADAVAGRGGAFVMMQPEFTPGTLAQKLRDLLENPAILEKTAAAAKACGRPDAASRLADLVERYT